MEDDCEWIRRFDFFDHSEAAAFWGFVGGIEDEVESGFDIRGGERVAVVEVDIWFEVEDVAEWIGRLPGFGEGAVEIHLGVAGEEGGGDEAVAAVWLTVGGEARVGGG